MLKKQQLVEVNPFKAVSRIKKIKAAKKKAFTLSQFKELLEKTKGEWKTLIMIAGLTGQRQKDCSTLRWLQVDFDKGVIEFERQKNSDCFTVPMASDACGLSHEAIAGSRDVEGGPCYANNEEAARYGSREHL